MKRFIVAILWRRGMFLRRISLLNLFLLISFLQIESAFSTNNTIGHSILNKEAMLADVNIDQSSAILDDLLSEGKAYIGDVDIRTKEDAISFLEKVASFIFDEKKYVIEDTLLLSDALTPRHIDGEDVFYADCDLLSYIYLSLGDIYNIPISAVLAPYHMYVRLFYNGGFVDWETISGTQTSAEEMISLYEISHRSVQKGYFLRALNRKETIDYSMLTIAIFLGWERRDTAMTILKTVLSENETFHFAYSKLGVFCFLCRDLEMSDRLLKKALQMHPEDRWIKSFLEEPTGEEDSHIPHFEG